jgi:flagellar motor switch protein FliG
MNDYDRIKKIADTLPDLDRAFLNKVAESLREKDEALAVHIKTHELNFSSLEYLMEKVRKQEQGK